MTTTFLTATGSYSKPGNWNDADNSIECVGPGGDGAADEDGGAGGGGGAYAKIVNEAIASSTSVTVGTGGSTTDTAFGTACIADAGKNAVTITGGAGGLATGSTGTTKYDGGAGGTVFGNNNGGGGGGGAAGPTGAGKAGGTGANSADAGNGGGGSNGGSSTAGGAAGGVVGGAGGHGTGGTGGGAAGNPPTAGTAGGARIALELAAQRNDIKQIITVAGNMDPTAWTLALGLKPLTVTQSNSTLIRATKQVPQIYFIGDEDSVIPSKLVKEFANQYPAHNRPRVIVIRDNAHVCCWVEQWPELWKTTSKP